MSLLNSFELNISSGTSLAAGRVGDIIGRRGTLFTGAIVFAIGGAIQTFTVGFVSMIIGRVVSGFGVGLLSLSRGIFTFIAMLFANSTSEPLCPFTSLKYLPRTT